MISIIIPCYNAEKTIKKCVSSILNQTYQDFEIILINDYSTDDTLFLLSEFKKKWPNKIVVINKKRNEGVDLARFDGINEAKGDFLTFLDADDWLELRTLEVMYSAMQQGNFDYVEVGMNRVLGKHGWIKKKSIQSVIGEISQPELFEKYYISFFGVNILSVNMCGKLYRKSFLDSVPLRPSHLAMGEDLYFNLILFPYLKKIKIVDYVGYHYRFGGMTTKYNPHLFPNLERLYSYKLELAKKYGYLKAIPYLLIEAKNVFKSDIKQRILYKNESKDKVIKYIKGLFTSSHCLKGVCDFYKNENNKIKTDDFIVGLRKLDYERMYWFCYNEVKKERKIRCVKRCLNFIFRYI